MKLDPFAEVFEPAPSGGWAWLLGLTALCVLPFVTLLLPGLALWSVIYVREGKIYMCATRMSRDVLLIRTAKRRYGITPANEQALVLTLLPKLPKMPETPQVSEGVYFASGA